MFGLFKKKSKKEKLEAAYRKKLEEAHKMSTINRSDSDALLKEAEDILDEIKREEAA